MKIDPFKTIHLEPGCTMVDCLTAVDTFMTHAGKRISQKERQWLATQFQDMTGTLIAPFEIQLGAPQAPPLIIIYPAAGRADGKRIKEKAIKAGEWGIMDAETGSIEKSSDGGD